MGALGVLGGGTSRAGPCGDLGLALVCIGPVVSFLWDVPKGGGVGTSDARGGTVCKDH